MYVDVFTEHVKKLYMWQSIILSIHYGVYKLIILSFFKFTYIAPSSREG